MMTAVWLYLFPGADSAPAHVVEYSVGDTVTIKCPLKCRTPVTRDNINQITWRKYNSHFLLFSSTQNLHEKFSNFSTRFIFEDLLTLWIMDAQPGDSGNYSCQLSTSAGYCYHHFSLQVYDLVSPVRAVELEYSLGDTVTINCLEGCKKSLTRDNINQITWRKYNISHILLSSKSLNLNLTSSNFSMRFNFQDPLTLRIRDAQLSDSGNYSCQIASTAGFCDNNFTLHVSGKSSFSDTWSYLRWIIAPLYIIITSSVLLFHEYRR
ncbi:tyrosine-protein kinase-like otk [Pyxicephalus adspersus]|uniref:tyrosine-protein kinase-like otk n=1 Tax=Pyxicephalus adspersus TaxID=30357 RepID=UPI003B59E534